MNFHLKNRIFPLLVLGSFGKSLSVLFRFFALKQNLRKPLLIRALKNGSFLYTPVFALYFFQGGGVRVGAGLLGGLIFRDNYNNNSNNISPEINFQLLFLISLSFSKIYQTLPTNCRTSQSILRLSRIQSASCTHGFCRTAAVTTSTLHLCIDISVCYAFLCRSYNCVKTAPKKRGRRCWGSPFT